MAVLIRSVITTSVYRNPRVTRRHSRVTTYNMIVSCLVLNTSQRRGTEQRCNQ